MTHKLSIAVDIADVVKVADDANQALDVERAAGDIARRHPESGVPREHIAGALVDESDAAGVERE